MPLVRRNRQRAGNRQVPVPAIVGTFRKLRPPAFEKGYDALHTVTVAPDGTFFVRSGIVSAFLPYDCVDKLIGWSAGR
jgi:hypothetical protein